MIRLVRHTVGAAIVALSCCAVASAQAPEFGRCVRQVAVGKTYHGKYSNANCTKPVSAEEEAKKGKYEWEAGPGAKNNFTTTGGAMTIDSGPGRRIECTSEQSAGEFVPGTDNKDITTTILFQGCSSRGFKCTSNGHKSGEVETNPLAGEVNWENKAKQRTALALRAAPGHEGLIFDVFCAFDAQVRGGVLVALKNDKMTEANTLKYAASKQHVQKLHVWHVGEESEEMVNLELSFERFPFIPTGLTLEMTMKGEEPLELNAAL